MDRRFIAVLGVSLVGALIIASIFYQIEARASAGKHADGSMETKDIVLASRPLTVGVTVKPTDVKIGKIVASAFPKGAFSKVEEVVDRPIISNILLDEPVLEGRLAARGTGLGLAPVIPVGMRAVSVRVNDVAGVAGFVFPGMRVDVLVTGNPPNQDQTMTATCLQNLIVLSAGTVMQPDAKGQAMPAPTVTLLATPEQAEVLTLANNQGRLQLVLRNGSDQQIAKTQAKEVAELYGVPAKKKTDRPVGFGLPRAQRAPAPVAMAAPAPAPPPPPPPDQIVVIRGTQKSVETVGPNRFNQ